MGLIANLPEIERRPGSVFVMHEKSEKHIPFHRHSKGQLSYVEGGLAYITTEHQTFVVPARHYFWIPVGMLHELKVGVSATVLRSLYFYAGDDDNHEFYSKFGIYPATELIIQMINYTERWDETHVESSHDHFSFLVALKQLLPTVNVRSLPIALPNTDHELLKKIMAYLNDRLSTRLFIRDVSNEFAISERSLMRLFQTELRISFVQYIKTLRVITAIELLMKTDKLISEIAFEVGYLNPGAFSDSFYHLTSSRPSDLRRHNT